MLFLVFLCTVSSNLLREDIRSQSRRGDVTKTIGLDSQNTQEHDEKFLNRVTVTSQGETIPMTPGILRVSPAGGASRNVMPHNEGSLFETSAGDPAATPPVVSQPQPSAVGTAPPQPTVAAPPQPIVAAPPQPIVAAPPQPIVAPLPQPIVAAPQQPAPIVAPPLQPIVAAPQQPAPIVAASPQPAPIVAAPPQSPLAVPAQSGQNAEPMGWLLWLLMVMGIVVLLIAGYYVYWRYSIHLNSVTAYLGNYSDFLPSAARAAPENQADYMRSQMPARTMSRALSSYTVSPSHHAENEETPGYAAMRAPIRQESPGREDARRYGSESERSGGTDRHNSDRMERRKSYGERRKQHADEEPERGNPSKDRTRDILRSPRQRTPKDDVNASPIDFNNLPPSRRVGGKKNSDTDF